MQLFETKSKSKIIGPSYFKSFKDLMAFIRKPIVNWQSYGWLFDFFQKN